MGSTTSGCQTAYQRELRHSRGAKEPWGVAAAISDDHVACGRSQARMPEAGAGWDGQLVAGSGGGRVGGGERGCVAGRARWKRAGWEGQQEAGSGSWEGGGCRRWRSVGRAEGEVLRVESMKEVAGD